MSLRYSMNSTLTRLITLATPWAAHWVGQSPNSPLIASLPSSSVAMPLKITTPSGDISSVRELGAEGWGQMVVDVSGAFGFLQPEIYDVYAANDIEAVVADVTAFSAENFAASLSDMTMPVLLLAGTEDSDHAALEDTAKKLPNATFASLPGFDHAATFLQTDLVLEHVTKFLAQVEKAGLGDATVA